MKDAITFTIVLSHEDIRDADKNNALSDLLAATGNEIRTKLTEEVQRWLAQQKKARNLKGGTEG